MFVVGVGAHNDPFIFVSITPLNSNLFKYNPFIVSHPLSVHILKTADTHSFNERTRTDEQHKFKRTQPSALILKRRGASQYDHRGLRRRWSFRRKDRRAHLGHSAASAYAERHERPTYISAFVHSRRKRRLRDTPKARRLTGVTAVKGAV